MWIQREIKKQILQSAKKRPCVLLTGARQTGKTSLLEKTFPHYNFISLDLPHTAHTAQNNGAWFLEKYKPPLIIDEIQYAPNLLRFLKTEIDKKRSLCGRYILSGSQRFSLMEGVTESLSGRISIFECCSLSLQELHKHRKIKKISSQKILRWMIQGGYPELHSQNLQPERFYSDYLATYLERDVRQVLRVKDLAVFNQFLRLLAVRSGQVLSMQSLSVDVGVSSHTIKSWLSVLEASSIIYLLRPFYNNYGKRLIKSPKLYFLDTGLLCFLAGIHNISALAESTLLGSFFETLCLGQIVRDFYNKGQSPNLYYFRDNHGNEVDFIQPEGNKVHLYECKWKFQSGFLPKNLKKISEIFGAGSIKSCSIITSSSLNEQIEKKLRITNPIKL